MLDVMGYSIATSIVILFSFIGFIVLLTIHIVKKEAFKGRSLTLLIIYLLGLYLFIPYKLYFTGMIFREPKYIERALKLSINPYERKLCYASLGELYGPLLPFEWEIEKLNGNLAIKYYEKVNKDYKFYNLYLAHLYLLKGDYNKVLELTNDRPNDYYRRLAYTLNGDYEEAFKTFTEKNKDCGSKFLKAALLEQMGDVKTAHLLRKEAQTEFEKNIQTMKEPAKSNYIERINSYKSIEALKLKTEKERKLYKF